MPTYMMQSTPGPKGICDNMDQCNRKFLWSSDTSKKKIHLTCRKKVTKSKEVGGVAIREAKLINESLLAKIGWKIMQQGNSSIWSTIFQNKYSKKKHILHYECKAYDSPVWKGIVHGHKKLCGNIH